MTDWFYPERAALTTDGIVIWNAQKGEWIKDSTSAKPLVISGDTTQSNWQSIQPIAPVGSELPEVAFVPAPGSSMVAWW